MHAAVASATVVLESNLILQSSPRIRVDGCGHGLGVGGLSYVAGGDN